MATRKRPTVRLDVSQVKELLKAHCRQMGWTDEQLAYHMGLERSDFYKARNRKLTPGKQARFDQYVQDLLKTSNRMERDYQNVIRPLRLFLRSS